MTGLVIETKGLTKRYGDRTAVEGLSIEVPAGVVAGFVGPNGAGKTTTMSMLLGLIAPTDGEARVLGEDIHDPGKYLARVGALIERPAFYPGLTGEENLRLLATIGGHEPRQVGGVLEMVGLAADAGVRFGAYSLGMKQRLGIAGAMLGDPELMILDEPTNGLDPAGIYEMRELVRRLADEGRAIFVSSHILAELEQVCDWFVMIERGSLVFQGATSEFLDGAAAFLVLSPEHDRDVDRLELIMRGIGHDVRRETGSLLVSVDGAEPKALAAEVNRTAANAGVTLTELRLERMNLEERYLAITNGGKR